ncbi:MAG: Uma2 family endonuclease [Planctomycetes bacterium]|nr:Uma2 family endonuclease [Planctomycetota bacterium]
MRTDLKITYKEYQTLPEGYPQYQLIDGDLYKMSPSPTTRHQKIVLRLTKALANHMDKGNLGTLLFAPMDVILDDENVFQPDILFVSKAREGIVQEKGVFGAPDLCVEVLSPSNFDKKMDVKRILYARSGVVELWLFHPDTNTVEVYRLQEDAAKPARTLNDQEALTTALLPGLTIELARVFAP